MSGRFPKNVGASLLRNIMHIKVLPHSGLRERYGKDGQANSTRAPLAFNIKGGEVALIDVTDLRVNSNGLIGAFTTINNYGEPGVDNRDANLFLRPLGIVTHGEYDGLTKDPKANSFVVTHRGVATVFAQNDISTGSTVVAYAPTKTEVTKKQFTIATQNRNGQKFDKATFWIKERRMDDSANVVVDYLKAVSRAHVNGIDPNTLLKTVETALGASSNVASIAIAHLLIDKIESFVTAYNAAQGTPQQKVLGGGEALVNLVAYMDALISSFNVNVLGMCTVGGKEGSNIELTVGGS
jgi:hypothetical protein